jgi:hypothetical protein
MTDLIKRLEEAEEGSADLDREESIMTPDELPADIEGRLQWALLSFGTGQGHIAVSAPDLRALLNSLKWARGAGDLARQAIKNRDEDYAALLKAYQEQRRALEDLLALPVAAQAFAYLDKGIGTKTPNAAWLRARAALNQKGDER